MVFLQEWDWGNVPAWLAAILTSLSFLVAAFTYRRSVLDKEREQAGKVAIWIASDGMLHLRNVSESAIYGVIVFYPKTVTGSDAERSRLRQRVDPRYRSIENVANVILSVQRSGSTGEARVPAWMVDIWPDLARMSQLVVRSWSSVGPAEEREVPLAVDLGKSPLPWLRFSDASGREWMRNHRGELERSSDQITRMINNLTDQAPTRPKMKDQVLLARQLGIQGDLSSPIKVWRIIALSWRLWRSRGR